MNFSRAFRQLTEVYFSFQKMFYERVDSHILETHMQFQGDGGYEDMCAGNSLKDDHWQKVQNMLPTPPCSPEELCYHTGFPEFVPAPAQSNNYQVVPDEISVVDVEHDALPVLDISDEEMQKLTSPTIFDDSMWQMQTSQSRQQPTEQCEVYEGSVGGSDVNYISHGIRTVHISDQVARSPAYSQSFVFTVNANPIQPLNTMGHLITREILATPSTSSSMISGKLRYTRPPYNCCPEDVFPFNITLATWLLSICRLQPHGKL